jgi:hypothetical protein
VITSYIGPPIDDLEVLERLPDAILNSLQRQNGFILEGGGFHVRGACFSPAWHSLGVAWEGEFALYRLFPQAEESDIPIAEDCFGDQFLLRGSHVLQLSGETGELEDTGRTWGEFIACAEADPVEFLKLQWLDRFRNEGGVLPPGSLLSVYPPFIAKECVNPSLRPIPALERRLALADFARQIQNLEDGQRIKITVRQ